MENTVGFTAALPQNPQSFSGRNSCDMGRFTARNVHTMRIREDWQERAMGKIKGTVYVYLHVAVVMNRD